MNQSTSSAVAATGREVELPRTFEHVKPNEMRPEGAARGEGPAASVSISPEAGQVAAIKDYVRRLFEEQGLELKGDLWDEMSVEDAQVAIGAGGEWSPEAVSDRIIDFVADISSGNPELKERLQEAVRQGFEESREALGGWLPEVSERTFEMVMKRFDEAFPQPKADADTASEAPPV